MSNTSMFDIGHKVFVQTHDWYASIIKLLDNDREMFVING